MKNKTLGIILLSIIGGASLSNLIMTNANDNFYILIGLGMIIFGTWSGIRLTKVGD